MTNDERLAIAEELLRKFPRNIYVTLGDGVTIRRIEMQSGPKWRGYRDGSDFWLSEDPIEVVCKARQKLAAERDAKKSEREKRLEEFALFAKQWIAGYGESHMLKLRAEEALKETP